MIEEFGQEFLILKLNTMSKGFTLVELIVVVVVIGILATFAIPQFAVTKERALDREAISVLGIIREAERAYRMEEGSYYPPAGSRTSSIPGELTDMNRELRLSVPSSSDWAYTVNSTGIVTAQRAGGPRPRILSLDAADSCDLPSCAGGGCFGAGGC